MAQPNLERLYLKLSQRIQDVRATIGETDTGHDYTKLQLVQAINNAIKNFINEITDKEKLNKIAIILSKYVEEVPIAYDGTGYPLSDSYLKAVSVEQDANPAHYIEPDNWQGVARAFNSEENDLSTRRWTQFNDKIYTLNTTLADIRALVVKKHNDIALGDSNDVLIDDSYDSPILKLAEAEIYSYSPIT